MSIPPNASIAARECRPATSPSEVTSPPTARPASPRRSTASRCAVAVDVERDHAGPGGGQELDDRAADPAGGAGDQRDLALKLARRRGERELVELERPVLDRKALRLVSETNRRPRRRRPSPRSRGGRGPATAAPSSGWCRARPGRGSRSARHVGLGPPARCRVRGGARRTPRTRRGSRPRPPSIRSAKSPRESLAGSYGTHRGTRLVCTRWSGHAAPIWVICGPSRESTSSIAGAERSVTSTFARWLDDRAPQRRQELAQRARPRPGVETTRRALRDRRTARSRPSAGWRTRPPGCRPTPSAHMPRARSRPR